MAHMVETMAYSGQVPWHGLGRKVRADLSPQEMLVEAGLDWQVSLQPLVTAEGLKVPGHNALVRSSDSSVFDVVGSLWKPIQNHEAFDLFNAVCAAGEAKMETAGSLKGGRRVWGLAKMGTGFALPGDDRTEDYLLFSNPHEAGLAAEVFYTPVRVVCNNTLTFALTGKKGVAYSHPHSRKWDPELPAQVLGVARDQQKAFQAQAELLAKVRCSEEEFTAFANDVFPPQGRTVDWLQGVYETQPGGAGEGTWWTAVNAVTYLVDHGLGRTADGRMNSAWFGYGAGVKRKALARAVELAKAA